MRPFLLSAGVLLGAVLAAGPAVVGAPVRAQTSPAEPEAAPGGSAARVSVDVRLERSAARPGDTLRAAVVLDIDEGWHANAHEPTLDYLIGTELTADPPPGITVLDVRYPRPEVYEFSFADGQPLAVYSGRSPIVVALAVASEVAPGRYGLDGTIRIQICNDEVCLPPSTLSAAIPVRVAGPEEQIRESEGPFPDDGFSAGTAETTPSSRTELSGSGAQIAGMFEERTTLLALLGVLLIGLALNLTPCVYPMLSVTVSLFGSVDEAGLVRSFGRALVYVAGMVLMYATLGTIAAYTGGLFGGWLQSPWVLGGIGAVLLLMAAGMLGAYQMRLPEPVARRLERTRSVSGLLGLFLAGLVVGLFAAPCIGPPIVGLLAFVGARGDPAFALSVFSTLGFGLGLPYLVLGTFSGLLDHLPRSGAWMVWVERVFGVVMVGAALFFLGLAVVPGQALYAAPLTLVGGGLYLGFLWKQRSSSPVFRRIRWGLGIAAIAVGVAGFAFLQKPMIEWQPYSPEILETARQNDQPVLLDFYADWCVPCLELDRITFADRRVIEATDRLVRVKVDLTRYDSPEAEAIRQKFDVAGVPTLVFLDGSGAEIPESRIVGYVGPDDFLDHLRSLPAARPVRAPASDR